MNTSSPIQNNTTVSFRCSDLHKRSIETTAKAFRISNSELIRYGVELMIYLLNNPESCERVDGRLRDFIYAITDVTSTDNQQASDGGMPALLETIKRQGLDLRNIALLNYDEHVFDGCRVTITYRKLTFERYFSAKAYGSIKAAFDAACAVRDYVRNQLKHQPSDAQVEEIYAKAQLMMSPPSSNHQRCISLLSETDKSSFHSNK